MTKKITPAAAPILKPTPAPTPAATPTPLAKEGPLERGAAALAAAATCWHKPHSDPRQDVCNARANVRSERLSWPTVLTLSPSVFEDLLNHPGTLEYLAAIQLERTYDVRHPSAACQFLAPRFGVKEVKVNVDEPAASLS